MRYKAIIFDMDGTIIDTEHIWKQATIEILNKRGVVHWHDLRDLQEQLKGMALHESCALLKRMYALNDDLNALVFEKSQNAVSLYQKEVRFIEGFTDFHQKAIQMYGLKTGVATNADDATVAVTENKLALSKLFGSHVYGISCVNNQGKPNPAIYLHAAKQLQIVPEECIAIEDSAHGIRAAKNAGMYCIGINTSKNSLQLKDAHIVIDGYQEINLEKILK